MGKSQEIHSRPAIPIFSVFVLVGFEIFSCVVWLTGVGLSLFWFILCGCWVALAGSGMTNYNSRNLATQLFSGLYFFLLQLIIFIRDLSFGILFIRKLHQIHFVFLLIILGYQSLFYTSSLFSSQDLISIVGKEFTSHRIQILSFFISSLVLSLVFIFG